MKVSKFLPAVLAALTVTAGFAPKPALAAPDDAKVPVIISYNQAPQPFDIAVLQSRGGEISAKFDIIPAMAARVPASSIDGLSRNPRIRVIEPDGLFYASDAELDNAWGVKRIGSGTVHAGGITGAGVSVAICDSGIDYTHSDLNDNYVGGYDFVNNDDDPMDDEGHGTHVAGSVAAEDNGSGVVGVAPGASLYGLKVLDSSGSGNYSWVISALQWCASNDIDVANFSLSSNGDPGSAVENAFIAAYNAGVISFAASGNDGRRNGRGDTCDFPARYPIVIAVASTTSSDSRSSFSSTGPDVELAAPGSSIVSTYLGGGYASASGTSMASPHAAGLAALVIQAGLTSPDDIRAQMQSTAIDLGDTGRDDKYGFGLIDAVAATSNIGPQNDAPVAVIGNPADGTTFSTGASVSFSGSGSDTEDGDVTASLVWTSSIDGQIGTGASFNANLTDGNHTIIATATDSKGKTGSTSIGVTVGNPPSNEMTVESITYSTYGGKGRNLRTTVTVVDSSGSPVADASVSVNLTNDAGGSWTGSGTTNADGKLSLGLRNAPSATYTTTVTSVTKSGLTWDGITPPNSYTKS
jgi:subtilisin family serine protease